MTPSVLLECLLGEGFTVRAVPAQHGKPAHLLVDPGAKLPAGRVALIKENREGLIALLLAQKDEDAEWEAKAEAQALEAVLCDPFADDVPAPDCALLLSEGGAPVEFRLRQSVLIRVSLEGEPPEYVAIDPGYWSDLEQWAKDAKQANARNPPKRPKKVRKR